MARFVVNVVSSRKSVLAVDMWGSLSGVNAGSIPAQKRGTSSIVPYAKSFPAIIIYRHMTRVKASGEPFIEQDNSYTERKSAQMRGYRGKPQARTLIRNTRNKTQNRLVDRFSIVKDDLDAFNVDGTDSRNSVVFLSCELRVILQMPDLVRLRLNVD